MEGVKYNILRKLKKSMGRYVSGEEIGKTMGISRTAIWKHVNELKKAGYAIDSSQRNGYKLVSIPDVLSSEEIKSNLDTKIMGKRILCFDEVDSTNNVAKKTASESNDEGIVIIAETQTAGKGRLAREWVSPGGKGIWMSIILRPAIPPYEVQVITLAASIAVIAAIKQVTGLKAGIKWPNDIILGEKKVCGILLEMSTEVDRVNHVIVGIGINVHQDNADFPEKLRDTAVSIRSYALDKGITIPAFKRSELLRVLLSELERLYESICCGNTAAVIEEWKQHNITLGREVRFVIKDRQHAGTAIDITPEGKLVVCCNDGRRMELISGEVSIRGVLGHQW